MIGFARSTSDLVLREGTMDLVLFHAFVLMNMLRAEGVILAEKHSHAQQHHCSAYQSYGHQNLHMRTLPHFKIRRKITNNIPHMQVFWCFFTQIFAYMKIYV